MTDDTPTPEALCPVCGRSMVLLHEIRRAFAENLYVFKCKPCGFSATESASTGQNARAAVELTRVCTVSIVPHLWHSNVRVMGPLSWLKMVGITHARHITFPHFGQFGASMASIVNMAPTASVTARRASRANDGAPRV